MLVTMEECAPGKEIWKLRQRAGTRRAQQCGIKDKGFGAMAAGTPSPAVPLSSYVIPGK